MNYQRFPSLPGLLVLSTALAAVLCSAGCNRLDEHEGGLFAPFEGGVVSQAGGDASASTHSGGTMDLPPASDFVSDEDLQGLSDEPLVVDTGGPPAVLTGGEDGSAETATGADGDADAALAEAPGPDGGIPGSLTAADAVVPAEPIPPPVAPVAQPPVAPPTTAPQIPVEAWRPTAPAAAVPAPTAPVATTGCNPEAALVYSTPLSEIALVAAIPDAAPPRAIVRFPGGTERVVQVGDLLGDSGAKVVFIGPGHIKLAEVTVVGPDQPDIDTHYLHLTR